MALNEYMRSMGTIALGSASLALMWGTGSPDGNTDPYKSAAKGTLFIRTDATDDHSPLYLKVDDDNSDDDWVHALVANQASAANFNANMTLRTDKRIYFRDTDGGYWYSTSGSVMQGGAASSVHIGDGTNDAVFEADGHLSFAGTARSYVDVWVPAVNFTMTGCDFANDPIYLTGSMQCASLLCDVNASAFADIEAGSVRYSVLQPSANVTGSMTHTHATFPVPTNADTTGSVSARLVWTSKDTLATTGSVFVFKAGVTYLSSSAAERTAASVGASPAYNYTAAGVFHETALGDLPSFGADDVMGFLTIGHDQSEADDTGGSGVAILGCKLRYVANSLGTGL